MKEFIKNLSWFKVLACLLAIIIVIGCAKVINRLPIKKSELPVIENAPLAESLGVLGEDLVENKTMASFRTTLYSLLGKDRPAKNYEIKVAENGGRELYVNTDNLNVRVVDTATKEEWTSQYMSGDGSGSEISEKAPMTISYLSQAGALTTWDAFTYCIDLGQYTINAIENGFRAELEFYKESTTNFDEFMPKKISISRFESAFIGEINARMENGTMDKDDGEKYLNALGLIYAIDEDEGCYYNRSAGNLPASAVSLMVKFVREIGYTTDMLRSDNAEFGEVVEITVPAHFFVNMEVTLDDGDLIVKVPSYESRSENEDYAIQNIAVFPNFGLISAKDYQDGFIFVPDGSGAIMDINTYDSSYSEYTRDVYANDYYDTMYKRSEYAEDIHMPVFGMAREKDGKAVGFLGIIEEGAQTAYINAKLGNATGSNEGTPYNRVYSSFDAEQFSSVKVFGAYSESNATFLARTGPIDVNYTVRYKLIPENATYFEMAQEYKNYLMNKYTLKSAYSEKPRMFIDVVSALHIEDRIAGIPYDRELSMTDYDELDSIIKALDASGVDAVYSYQGAFNGGLYNYINRKAKLSGSNGSKSKLNALVEKYGDRLYLTTGAARVYREGKGFTAKRQGLISYNGDPLEIYDYDIPTGQFNLMDDSSAYWVINPHYLKSVIGQFSSANKGRNLGLLDLGNLYYANYSSSDIVNPYVGEKVIEDALTTLGTDRSLLLYNPNMNTVFYGDYAADVSRESSDYGLFKHNIPFRQIVLNGLVDYTTLNVNMSTSDPAYFLLQSIEIGAMPKFTVTYKSEDVLKEAYYNKLFSVEFEDKELGDEIPTIKQQIEQMSNEIGKAFGEIGSTRIVGHEVLDDNVFKTDYDGGKSVIVNYNTYETVANGQKIAPQSYVIVDTGARVYALAEAAVEETEDAEPTEEVIEEGGEN